MRLPGETDRAGSEWFLRKFKYESECLEEKGGMVDITIRFSLSYQGPPQVASSHM